MSLFGFYIPGEGAAGVAVRPALGTGVMLTSDDGSDSTASRNRRIREVLEEVARRRLAGETLCDADVINAHAELLPELRTHLAALESVEDAERRAHGEEDQANGPLAMVAEAPSRWLTESIPGYEIEGEIHRGGQGVLYRARQLRAARLVAIKVLREGPFVGPRDKARFEREVRVLAQLRHPNIVTIYDSGVTTGCHFFVMDYIEGEPLDAYVSGRRLSVHQKLRLFVKICGAVHAAHLRGVIHRDLKPSNIRVDSEGEPHVLDFGLAKISADDIHEATQWRNMTMTGQFVGSLPWASPEQADGPPDRIDMRTDVYSLGIILYHMLTGRFPYPVIGNMREVLAHVLETDPLRPRSISGEVDEDVENIVLKCLAKRPEERYQSVVAIVEDIERHLRHEPILARAPSATYQIRKLVRRHRLPVAAACLFAVMLLAFGIAMAAMYGRAAAQRDRALQAEQAARSAQEDARRRTLDAEREAETANAIRTFLVDDLLASAQPENTLGRKITVEEVVANASERIETAFRDQPEIEASVRRTLGRVYQSLGLYNEAAAQRFEAMRLYQQVHSTDVRVLYALRSEIVTALGAAYRWDEARQLCDEWLDGTGNAPAPDDDLTLGLLAECAPIFWYAGDYGRGGALAEEVLEARTRIEGPEAPATLAARELWADLHLRPDGRHGELESVQRERWEDSLRRYGAHHPATYELQLKLGVLISHRRRFDEAEPLIREAYEGLMRTLGERHPTTLQAVGVLSRFLMEQGWPGRAVDLTRRAVEEAQAALGQNHKTTSNLKFELASFLARKGCCAEAAELYHAAATARVRTLGEVHTTTVAALTGLACAWSDLGRLFDSERVLEDALRRRVQSSTPDDVDQGGAWTLRNYVRVLGQRGRAEEARPYAEQLLEHRRRWAERPDADAHALNSYARDLLDVVPEDLRDPETALTYALLGAERSPNGYHYNRYTVARAYAALGELDFAIEFARRALDHSPLEYSSERAEYEAILVRLLERTEGPDAAEQVYRNTLATRREQFPAGHPDIAASLFDLGDLLNRHEKYAEAEPYLRESLELREALLDDPPSEPCRLTLQCNTAHTLLALSQSLVGQQRRTEAEPLLLEAYDRLAENENCHAELLPTALRALATLYQTQGQEERAASYAELLAEGTGK